VPDDYLACFQITDKKFSCFDIDSDYMLTVTGDKQYNIPEGKAATLKTSFVNVALSQDTRGPIFTASVLYAQKSYEINVSLNRNCKLLDIHGKNPANRSYSRGITHSFYVVYESKKRRVKASMWNHGRNFRRL